ncbi:MAG: DUF881 domain-containing protein [Candidatus Nanopelagicales bacterium]
MTDPDALPEPPEPPEPTLTEPEGRRRLRDLLAPRRTSAQLVIGLLFVVLGFTAVAVIHGNDEETFLQTARSADLVRVLDDLSAQQLRLQSEARRLEVARDRLEAGGARQALEETRKRADGLAILAGTVAATGPGVVITLQDPGYAIDGTVLLDTVQELRAAGAEAIQVADHRVVVSTWFGDVDGSVVVDGDPVSSPYVVTAIGPPETLAKAMEIPGGVADTVRAAGGSILIETRDRVAIDAVQPLPTPEYASPAPEAEG